MWYIELRALVYLQGYKKQAVSSKKTLSEIFDAKLASSR
jgi:hypothetical protein